ncbi:MAG: hypothetical protein ACOYMA_20965 [Bacteroidia bacterium]
MIFKFKRTIILTGLLVISNFAFAQFYLGKSLVQIDSLAGIELSIKFSQNVPIPNKNMLMLQIQTTDDIIYSYEFNDKMICDAVRFTMLIQSEDAKGMLRVLNNKSLYTISKNGKYWYNLKRNQKWTGHIDKDKLFITYYLTYYK